jgi:hypothetical protein
MKPNLKSHISIAEQIVEGSLDIKTIAEFKSILKIFPNDPALQKVFSELLLNQKHRIEAAESYAKAAQLFAEAGKFLRAIDCKLLQWQINRKKVSALNENQFFGDIYPFKDDHTSKSFVETATQTEVLCIAKSNLIKVCKKYPNIEMRLLDLYHVRKKTDAKHKAADKVRKIGRHQLPLKINLHIFTDANQHEPLVLDCYSRDISVDGLCVILDGKYKSISSIYKSVKTAKIELSLPKEELSMKVSGTIVWSREFRWKKRKIVALGFQFKDMSPKFRGMFFMMADSICGN